MDYRELLLKYINHVGESEGTTFLLSIVNVRPNYITEDEWAELLRCDDESKKYKS